MPVYRTFDLYTGGEASPGTNRKRNSRSPFGKLRAGSAVLLPMHQAALDCANCGLRPVANAHLIQDAAYMDAHGFLGNT
jgi:hypothetical protein